MLADLIRGTGASVARGGGGVVVADVTEDSRSVVPGALFIARPGREADGRRYIAEAVRAGAVAVLTDADPGECGAAVALASDPARAGARAAERFFGEPSRALRVVGVTGTNGKSTVVHMTRALLGRLGARCGLIGTIETDDGADSVPSSLTTPSAVELSRTLGAMVRHGCVAAAIEVSSHALHQGRVAAVRADAAIFTNLTGDHLDYHRTMEAYADAKALLFEGLDGAALAIVNADDPACARMLRGCMAPRVRCSLDDPAADAHAEWHAVDDGMRIRARGPWGEAEAWVRAVGAHNAMNTLQALAAAWRVSGAGGAALAHAAEGLVGPVGRLEPVHSPGDDVRVYIDYAHTDDALRRCLTAARGATRGRLWVVFGCGGERDATKRPRMGAAAHALADHVVVTSDNPRREEPSAIIAAILEGVDPAGRGGVEVLAERAEAIRHAVRAAGAGDTVVVAGKGHEREQVVSDGAGGVARRPFDDAAHARAALERRRSTRGSAP